MSKKQPVRPPRIFPVVGIGASAGGLEAVSRLLSSLPEHTGMAFVVIQHLDPTRESFLPAILQKSTSMSVAQAENGIVIRPDHVYVIPPNTHMGVADGKLVLIPRPEGVHGLAVDYFLNSLAEERGNQAIAVILSGTASDGTLGVKAIKAEGGIVFAQDEESAGHFGMPMSATATGVVDFVLPPEKIAEELGRIAQHPILSPNVSALFEDTKSLSQIFVFLRRATGVDFSLYKASTIKRRLMRRLYVHKLEKLDQYAKLLKDNPDEVQCLHDDLLIHVTRFFREPKCLEILRSKVLPRILKALPPEAPIRVWVPGCSSGEEAYTLAIVLLDFLSERDAVNPVQIFATDIAESALERARSGVYAENVQNHVPLRLLRRFFTKVDRGYEIVKRVRDLCVFAKQDLTKDPPFGNLDIISCCNVLIYLSAEAQKRILPIFHYALRPSGALVLGNAETIGEFGDLFAAADINYRIYYKKPAAARPPAMGKALQPADRAREEPFKKDPSLRREWPESDVQRVAERILLSRFAPAGIIVDGDLSVLHFRGPVNRVLEHATGKASLDLVKMLPAHFARTMISMIAKAKKSEAPVRENDASLGGEGVRSRKCDVEVIPFRLPVSGQRYYIVLFDDEAPRSRTKSGKRDAPPSRPEPLSIKRLKSELSATRGYLQTIVEEHEAANEELKSANEEIISSNEELQSTNEELEIAKEELQAANEELGTVNDELQSRNVELSHLNDDLQNFLSSVHIPMVMVSSDLRVRRFTPAAEKIMNFIPSDLGRPIGDIKSKIDLPNIEEIVHEVIETVTSKELDVRDVEGRSYLVRIRPYKTMENQIEGAVIVIVQNDPVQRMSLGLKDAAAFEAALEIGPPMAVLDSQLRVKAGSRSLYQAFGLSPSLLGRSLFEVEGGRWESDELHSYLERLAHQGQAFRRLPARIGDRDLLFSARRIMNEAGGPPLILLTIENRS